MHQDEVDFARWEKTPPPELFGDAIWRLPAYRLSRFLALVVDKDIRAIVKRHPSRAEQLERAVDSIGLNITEGYGRLHGRERARFYEYALGSAGEARDLYAPVQGSLSPGVALSRAKLLSRTIRILTSAIPQERAGSSEKRIKAAIERSKQGARAESARSAKGESRRPPKPAPAPASPPAPARSKSP